MRHELQQIDRGALAASPLIAAQLDAVVESVEARWRILALLGVEDLPALAPEDSLDAWRHPSGAELMAAEDPLAATIEALDGVTDQVEALDPKVLAEIDASVAHLKGRTFNQWPLKAAMMTEKDALGALAASIAREREWAGPELVGDETDQSMQALERSLDRIGQLISSFAGLRC